MICCNINTNPTEASGTASQNHCVTNTKSCNWVRYDTEEYNTDFKTEFVLIEEEKFIIFYILSIRAVYKTIYRAWFNFERKDHIHISVNKCVYSKLLLERVNNNISFHSYIYYSLQP